MAKAQREGARENAARVNELKRLIDELQVSNKTVNPTRKEWLKRYRPSTHKKLLKTTQI